MKKNVVLLLCGVNRSSERRAERHNLDEPSTFADRLRVKNGREITIREAMWRSHVVGNDQLGVRVKMPSGSSRPNRL